MKRLNIIGVILSFFIITSCTKQNESVTQINAAYTQPGGNLKSNYEMRLWFNFHPKPDGTVDGAENQDYGCIPHKGNCFPEFIVSRSSGMHNVLTDMQDAYDSHNTTGLQSIFSVQQTVLEGSIPKDVIANYVSGSLRLNLAGNITTNGFTYLIFDLHGEVVSVVPYRLK